MKINRKIILYSSLLGLLISGIFVFNLGKNYQKNLPIIEVKSLKDLAYNVDKENGYKIYIKENGKLEPYFVVKRDYLKQKNVLLLREFLLNNPIKYSVEAEILDYSQSFVDEYLNDEFNSRFSQELLEQIEKTFLPLLSKEESLRPDPEKFIQRKFFSLSKDEVFFRQTNEYLKFEEPLYFFGEKENKYRSASFATEMNDSWWLRSALIEETILPQFVDIKGNLKTGRFNSTAYLRPAFCLPPFLRIEKQVLDGKEIYVLSDFE